MRTKRIKPATVVVGAAVAALAMPGSAFAGATQIDSGLSNTCAVKTVTHKVICWGNGGAKTVPSSVGTAIQVSVGTTSACAIKRSNSHVACWGSNSKGQRTPPSTLGPVTQVSVGNTWACAIKKSDSHVVCWGGPKNDIGTVPASLGAVSEVTANEGVADAPPVCAIRKSDGSVGCWGGAWDTELNKAYTPFWTAAQGATGLAGLAGKGDCSISHASGLPIASFDPDPVLTGGIAGPVGGCPFVPQSLGQVNQISRGDFVTCAVKKADSHVACWTSAENTDLGTQPATSGETTVPTGLGAVVAVTVGGSREPNNWSSTAKSRGNVCAIQNTTARKAVCWGSTYYKQTTVPSTL